MPLSARFCCSQRVLKQDSAPERPPGPLPRRVLCLCHLCPSIGCCISSLPSLPLLYLCHLCPSITPAWNPAEASKSCGGAGGGSSRSLGRAGWKNKGWDSRAVRKTSKCGTMTIKSGLGKDLPGSGWEGGPDLSRESSGPAPAPIYIGWGTQEHRHEDNKVGGQPQSCPGAFSIPGWGNGQVCALGRAGSASTDYFGHIKRKE